MPELPEVETITRELRAANIVGQTIDSVDVLWSKSVARPSIGRFTRDIRGQHIVDIQRRGKYVVFSLSACFLLCHLRMTGRLSIKSPSDVAETHERLRFMLSDKRALSFVDQRKFGRWYLVEQLETVVGHLGPEPVSPTFTEGVLVQRLEGRRRALKPLLLDQTVIAGLGNIYVDEALWEAGLHPLKPANELSPRQLKALHQAIVNVLQRGIEHMGTSLGTQQANYFSVSGRRGGNQHQLRVFRREGLPCPRCNTLITKTRVAQRGTHWCPRCQALSAGS